MAWYAVYTKSRAEKKLAAELTQLGIPNYLPIKKEQRRWSDRLKWVEVPAINGYLFVDITENQKEILYRQPHFVSFVRSFGAAAIIPEQQINAMRLTLENNLDFNFEPSENIIGHKVKIITPPLDGVEGIITKMKGDKFLYIIIETTGLSLVVNIAKYKYELVK